MLRGGGWGGVSGVGCGGSGDEMAGGGEGEIHWVVWVCYMSRWWELGRPASLEVGWMDVTRADGSWDSGLKDSPEGPMMAVNSPLRVLPAVVQCMYACVGRHPVRFTQALGHMRMAHPSTHRHDPIDSIHHSPTTLTHRRS